MLGSRVYRKGTKKLPTLVFLHGLLGSSEDWRICIKKLKPFQCIGIDLPGHGESRFVSCEDFEHCDQLVRSTLEHHIQDDTPVVLIGYSLGARIVMHGLVSGIYDAFNLHAAVIEGGNFGLINDEQKMQRLRNDEQWASRFESEKIEQVLLDWYTQPVFSSLNHEQRQNLIQKRSDNLGESVARMLVATSLAKQEFLLDKLKALSMRVHYVCGSKDTKFSRLAAQSQLSYSEVNGAGHNVHQEQPEIFSQVIRSIISESDSEPNAGDKAKLESPWLKQ
ncbi:2-succinyl-6-hydroxy-2,4-cyclohexadiene-1-carboxylate synthase [Vibrio marisflavi]|uniref:Putative 2-succinyl-6-hydroxy-2,4-cyclohexadiene-1-carboxylate synthase n=1 Tax=Vibrio marisflavi CECT 7928 TaxID=634439 RepID=A0ABM9A3Z5_9VIBR|nr:2-succinyl-6-hydroxy-2,4-cyclohexadiene-1-carboxylate synthase [Vibrio marisflavi]CAH0539320.1 2-succinyl-6-hydroxy-2, 4-cyclohexadiene-1-carboxylate synthase [Vibrio marisflavi CECT 7928]